MGEEASEKAFPRPPGKQLSASSSSRSLVDDAGDTLEITPDRCQRCDTSLAGSVDSGRQHRQVIDGRPVPPPKVTDVSANLEDVPAFRAVTTPGWDSYIDAAVGALRISIEKRSIKRLLAR